tara:strand:+ start:1278 stop:2987 length:1710 start_codon:yes stop_codon:yes gene_type:complete
MKFKVLLIFIFLVFSCERETEKLENIVQEYQKHNPYDFEDYPLGNFSEEYFRVEKEFAESLLQKLSNIDVDKLDENDNISYELLSFVLQDKVAYYDFERFLNPLLSDSGFHSSLVYNVRPMYSYNQVKNYLNKLNAIPQYVDQYLPLLRKGLEKGVSQPLIIFEGYESTYNDHITKDFESNYFYSPFKQLPNDITDTQRDSILFAAKNAIEKSVVPQFIRIKNFFENEYYKKTRTSIGVSETPNGSEFYQNRINYYTTSELYTADEIHQIGLKEVARIKKEMIKIIDELNFSGSFEEFFEFLRNDQQFYAKTPAELLMYARDISKRADEQLPRFFKTLPRKPYGVAPVPDAIAPKYTGGRYVGTSKNSTDPGYYWVNTYDLNSRTLYTIPALTVHEAVPGHHLQSALNNELGDSIPRFRRNLYLSAYGEGWGLYTEFLADEMGIYTTPYEQFGKFTYEMWRACRLVIDTGIHSKGWSRDEAVEYMSNNTALSLHEVNTEIDRYISWPGQALSYKIGELKIRELRNKAKLELKEKFDIREFHERILEYGTVTLSTLERRINKYIEETKNE